MKEVIIIGAGASGLMAAISSAKSGHKVTVLEKNEKAGKKIFITGKGRCNITNATDAPNLIANTINNPKFLYSAFNEFDSFKMMDFLEESGLRIVTERGNRVFPASMHSSDVIRTLKGVCDDLGVKFHFNTQVKNITKNESQDKFIINAGKDEFTSDYLILCTGGKSYPSTGSTGDGYKFAESFGHTVTELSPGLTGFNVKEEYPKDLMGLALKNVTLELNINGKKCMKEMGEMLFTHFGISGPLVLTASEYYNLHVRRLKKKKNFKGIEAKVIIDLKPALSEDELISRIERDFDAFKDTFFKNSLRKLLPKSMEEIMVKLSGIKPDKKAREVSKKEISELAHLFKNLELNISSLRAFEEAIITCGGINVKEINPKTMESKLCPGLYIAGEVMDVDALTGGFNLQIAWSTGYVAGKCE
ncbi:MAG: NAD(P)/FAD-dependent oxidoreductase [Lachnospiraceae bacterium]|nr:NAD(P)/FAD-dependent oxidoreductase [Lachnospiraceae bacterium]